jgi:hypothetical protein
MAASILVSCPHCQKQVRAPEEARGKKVRCKACGEIFPLGAPPGAKPPAPAKAQPKPKTGGARFEDEDDDGNPYGVTTLDLTPRCPACAAEMESEEAIICIACGYNTMTRKRAETLKVIRTTPLEWILWLGPGILSFLALIPLIGLLLYLWAARPELNWQVPWGTLAYEVDGDPPRDTSLYIRIWGGVFTLAAMFFATRFFVKRVILHFHPPLKLKSK